MTLRTVPLSSRGASMVQVAGTTTTSAQGGTQRPLQRVARIRELVLVLALALICGGIILREPRFLQLSNLEQVALSASLVCIAAVGQAMVIIARQVDLSVGAIVAMSAFVAVAWLEHHPDGSVLIVLLIACAVGLGLGLGNGLLVAVFRIPAIVATLGTLAIYRGGILVIAGGRQISATVLPSTYEGLTDVDFAGLPMLVWLAILITVVFGLVMRFTRFGRNLYALGSNPESARIAGIREGRHIAAAFVISGFLCGLVGFLWGARFGTVDAVIAPDLHFSTISAVVVGGVSIFGGSGTMVGAVLALVLVGVLRFGMGLMNLQGQVQDIVIGSLLILSILLPTVSSRIQWRLVWRRDALVRTAAAVAVLAIFVFFFFWSRSIVLSQ